MFPLPYPPPLDWILYSLFGLEIALLAGGLILGRPNEEQTGRLPRALRMLLSAILAVAALLGWQGGATGTPVQWYATFIFLGMAAGSIGDWIMAGLIPVPQRLIGGMAAFGLGHLSYIAALLNLTIRSERGSNCARTLAVAVMLSISAWGWNAHVSNPDRSKLINVCSLFYALLIGVMCALAIAVAVCDTHYVALAAGSLLFLTSDFVWGNWVIRGHFWKCVNDAIWATYVCGQLLIVYSVAAALNATLC